MFVLAVVATGGIVVLSQDGYQAIDIIFCVLTWAIGIGAVWLLMLVIANMDGYR